MAFKDIVLFSALVTKLFSGGIVSVNLEETIIRNTSAKLSTFLASGSGDVV